jgi:hypothetical protein
MKERKTKEISGWWLFISQFLLLLSLTSCIVSYEVLPEMDPAQLNVPKPVTPFTYSAVMAEPPKTQEPIFPLRSFYGYYSPANDLKRILKEKDQLFSEAVSTDTVPSGGRDVQVGVRVYIMPPSRSAIIAGVISHLAVPFFPPLIPYFTGEGGYLVSYGLYVDQELRKTYRYEIKRKGLSWVVLLPFTIANFFTKSEEDALRITAKQFFLDAHQEGYLR